jgi:Response regulator containing CheY-like receiver, AAA-type ATPase, and DNA-binding domains
MIENTLSTVDIAVLDDDLDFRHYIEDFLRDEGYAVRTFAHPGDLFADSEHRVADIVLLDMKMGEFTGSQVLEQILARWPKCASSSSPVSVA